jgi:hypothetical protein
VSNYSAVEDDIKAIAGNAGGSLEARTSPVEGPEKRPTGSRQGFAGYRPIGRVRRYRCRLALASYELPPL